MSNCSALGGSSDQLIDAWLRGDGRHTRLVVLNDRARRTVDQPLVVVPVYVLAIECLLAQVHKELMGTRPIDVDLVEHRVVERAPSARGRWWYPLVVVGTRAVARAWLLVPKLVAGEQQDAKV